MSYRIGIVHYLNTRPLTYTLEEAPFIHQGNHQIIFASPSDLYQALKNESIDLALLSSIALYTLPNAHIISRYGIASEGEVSSVGIFSDQPLNQLTTIYLDNASRSSIILARILLKYHWRLSPQLLPLPKAWHHTNAPFLPSNTGAVIIGDRALKMKAIFPYYYDLATAWHTLTNLPFIFALWIARHPIDPIFCKALDDFQSYNLSRIATIIQKTPLPHSCNLYNYYTQHICYKITELQMKGLKQFLAYVAQEEKIGAPII